MIPDQVRKDVLSSVEALKDELVWLASGMIRIPSVNPTYPGIDVRQMLGGETRVNEFLKPVLESMGLETDMWEKEKDRANLVGVYRGTGGGKSLIFNGHVDVVPPGPEHLWTVASPWSGKIVDGKIYGRGAADMKGGNAAAIIGLKAVLNAGYRPKGDVIIEDVVGEEMMNTSCGTGATVARGYRADAAIVVEPSHPPYRLGILVASPGVLTMRLTVRGKAVHTCMRDELVRAGGAGAQVGVSALDKGLIIYEGLRRLEEEWGQSKTHAAFTRPGHFTICPAKFIAGLHGIGFIPEECTLEYVIWHAPQDDPEAVKREVEEAVARYAQTDPWLRVNPPQVEWLMSWPPYDVPLDAPICGAAARAYESALGEPARLYGFAAVDDATFLNQAGIPAITLGPGSLRVAHAANEYVEVGELVDAAKVYGLAIVEWCGV